MCWVSLKILKKWKSQSLNAPTKILSFQSEVSRKRKSRKQLFQKKLKKNRLAKKKKLMIKTLLVPLRTWLDLTLKNRMTTKKTNRTREMKKTPIWISTQLKRIWRTKTKTSAKVWTIQCRRSRLRSKVWILIWMQSSKTRRFKASLTSRSKTAKRKLCKNTTP